MGKKIILPHRTFIDEIYQLCIFSVQNIPLRNYITHINEIFPVFTLTNEFRLFRINHHPNLCINRSPIHPFSHNDHTEKIPFFPAFSLLRLKWSYFNISIHRTSLMCTLYYNLHYISIKISSIYLLRYPIHNEKNVVWDYCGETRFILSHFCFNENVLQFWRKKNGISWF